MQNKIAIPIIVILIVITLLAFSDYGQEIQSYSTLYAQSESQSSEIFSLQSETSNLTGQNSDLQGQLNLSHASYNALLGNYTQKAFVDSSASVPNATLQIWGIQQTMLPHSYTTWDLLDTFDNHIHIATTQPANFLVLDLQNFVLFRNGDHFNPYANYTGINFNDNVTVSIGCGIYVLVIANNQNSSIKIIPYVTATHVITYFLTGVCGD
jgi:hypothetical protein